MLIQHQVNSFKRDYIIKRVNAPLVKAMVLLARRYPEPTHDNVLYPNSHILLNIQESFKYHWYGLRRVELYDALFRVLIVKYEHSPAWRNMLDWFLMMINKSDWQEFEPDRQMVGWRK